LSKYLIAGLGNIGEEYAYTRHNVGFLIADALAQSLAKEEGSQSARLFLNDKLAMVNHTRYRGKPVVIIKPTTYMNLSGKALNYWLQAEKIAIENLLVVADDLAIPYGTLRMRKKGSDGGHNGLTDIINTLNTQEFARLRFGIGAEFAKGYQVDYVLGKWNSEEEKTLNQQIEKCVDIVKSFITTGTERTMTAFNKK
jgi:peptidyl-tRNA hydrolase, PTH1 family